MGCFMCGRRRMSLSRDLSLSYIPRCASHGRIQWGPISVSSRPKWFRSADDDGREAGCEALRHTLWPAYRTHHGKRVWVASAEGLSATEVAHESCGCAW